MSEIFASIEGVEVVVDDIHKYFQPYGIVQQNAPSLWHPSLFLATYIAPYSLLNSHVTSCRINVICLEYFPLLIFVHGVSQFDHLYCNMIHTNCISNSLIKSSCSSFTFWPFFVLFKNSSPPTTSNLLASSEWFSSCFWAIAILPFNKIHINSINQVYFIMSRTGRGRTICNEISTNIHGVLIDCPMVLGHIGTWQGDGRDTKMRI